jgi:hypothetical protein
LPEQAVVLTNTSCKVLATLASNENTTYHQRQWCIVLLVPRQQSNRILIVAVNQQPRLLLIPTHHPNCGKETKHCTTEKQQVILVLAGFMQTCQLGMLIERERRFDLPICLAVSQAVTW